LRPCTPSHEPHSYYILEIGDVFIEEHISAPHVEDIGHEVSTSLFHDDKGSVTCNYFQNSDSDDVMVNLDIVVFKENSLYDDGMLDEGISSCDENEGSQVFEVSKENFQLDNHSLEMDYWTFFGDPIYDTDGDDSGEENVDYVCLGQPCLVGACE
jgi:hypothetical protein